METFHFALESGAYLMLGTSETVDGSGDLYNTVSREYHIYSARQTPVRLYPVPESVPQFRFEQQRAENGQQKETHHKDRISYGQFHAQLLEKYAPPSVVVNEEYEIVHLSENAGRYMQMTGGEPSQNLLKLVKPELRLELRSALYQGLQRRTNVELKNLKVNAGDTTETINIHVRPALEEGEVATGFILVLFEPVEDVGDKPVVLSRDEPVARHLEEELNRLKVQLRTSIEQHETQSEELKASNEELQAMNEELRSATEELETSKEELQSINEELVTVNQELKIKVEEISLSSNNLQNLINSTDIGTIFLDRSFRVNMFTPSAKNIFNLISNDYGRPLSDITHRLKNVNLQEDAETVIRTLTTAENEVETNDGKAYLMRVLPYRTSEDRIGGVVVTFIDITRRKETEQALRKSEERFRAFVTASTDVIYLMNADWTEMHNLRSEGFLAATDDVNTTWLQQYVPTDEQSKVFAAIRKSMEKKRIFELEHKVIRADGTTGWVFSRAVPLLNERNEIEEWFGAASDISHRRQAEEALRESEERLRITMESATDYAIITTDTNRIIEGWSSGAEYAFGYTADEVIGESADIIFTSEDIAAGAPEKEMKGAQEEGRAIDERWHRRKDGSRLFVSGVMRPIYDDTLIGYVKVARDMTEQQRAQENLRILEERYRIALQSAEMGAWDWNVSEDALTWSDQMYTLLGLQPFVETKNMEYFLRFVNNEDAAEFSDSWKNMIENGGVYQQEYRITRADSGQMRWMSSYGKAVMTKDGIVSRIVGVMFDVTETKLLEQQKEDFISIASHELRTPITSIKAYAEVLYDMFEEAKDVSNAALIKKLDKQVDRLIDLIRALLDTSKISGGKLMLHPEKFDIGRLVEERVEDLQQISSVYNIMTSGSEIQIIADRERIAQVITNLVTNAIKYSPRGGEINIHWEEKGENVELSVRDRGIGISEGMLRRVFDRFFRVKNATMQDYPGMGLGLYIAANIIYSHNGKIWVTSEPENGSVFYISIPKYYKDNEEHNNGR